LKGRIFGIPGSINHFDEFGTLIPGNLFLFLSMLKLVLFFAGNRKYTWKEEQGVGVYIVENVEIGPTFCRKP